MITNARLLRIDLPLPPGAGGKRQWTEGSAISIPVAALNALGPTKSAAAEKIALDRTSQDKRMILQIAGPAWVAAIASAGLDPGTALAPEMRLMVQRNTFADEPTLYVVREIIFPQAGGALGYWQALLIRD